MKIKIDKKRTLLTITTIIALIKTSSGMNQTADIIVQIMDIIGSIDINQKNEFVRLREKIELEIGYLFEYLDSGQCKTITDECFSMACIEKYIAEDNEIEQLAQNLSISVDKQTRDKSDRYDMEYIHNSEDYLGKSELLINRINNIISTSEVLRTFEHRIVGAQTLSLIKCMDKKLEFVLEQVMVPNSAYLWHMPRRKNVNREIFRLHYTAGNVHLYDREEEIALLMDFCGYDSDFKKNKTIPGFGWWMITGEGGTGKSRLAYEFSKLMEMKGWTVCYPFNNKSYALDKCSEMLPNDTLFIIDYTEMDLADIGSWLIRFGTNKYSDILVRVILIQRVAESIEKLNFCNNALDTSFIHSHAYNNGQFLRLKTISDSSLKQLIFEYGNSKISKNECEHLFNVLSDVDKLKRPLFAIAMADAFVDGVRISKKIELLDYLCNKEDDSIKGKVIRLFKDKSDELSCVAKKIFMMATMIGGMNLSKMLEKLLPDEYSYLQSLYGEQRQRFFRDSELFYINMTDVICDPIEPDIIGEYYVLKNIKNREDMLSSAWGVPYYMSRFVTRLYQDFEEHLLDIQIYLTCPRLPTYIEVIDNFTFSGCNKLLSVVIPESVKKIGTSAFEECRGLKEVVMANSVAELSGSVFKGCINLEKINLSCQISIIPALTFYKCCSLSSINIPNSVTDIEDGAFMNCISLRNACLESQSRLEKIGRAAFSNCVRLKMITIPCGVKVIGDSVFESCIKLETVKMYDEIETIGDSAFAECYKLKRIKLSKKLKHIGELAFAQCTNLEIVEFPNNTIKIAEGAFFRSANSQLIRNLKVFCERAELDFKTLYLRTGAFEFLAQQNPDLYRLKIHGVQTLDIEQGENLDELNELCEKIGFKVSVWKDLAEDTFLILEDIECAECQVAN